MKQIIWDVCIIRFTSTDTLVQDPRLTENLKYSVLSFVMQAEHVWHLSLCPVIRFDHLKIQTIAVYWTKQYLGEIQGAGPCLWFIWHCSLLQHSQGRRRKEDQQALWPLKLQLNQGNNPCPCTEETQNQISSLREAWRGSRTATTGGRGRARDNYPVPIPGWAVRSRKRFQPSVRRAPVDPSAPMLGYCSPWYGTKQSQATGIPVTQFGQWQGDWEEDRNSQLLDMTSIKWEGKILFQGRPNTEKGVHHCKQKTFTKTVPKGNLVQKAPMA